MIRDKLSKTQLSKNWFRGAFDKGISGKKPSKFKEWLLGAFVSPGASETQNLGYALKDVVNKP